jgi:hypothetical protein
LGINHITASQTSAVKIDKLSNILKKRKKASIKYYNYWLYGTFGRLFSCLDIAEKPYYCCHRT